MMKKKSQFRFVPGAMLAALLLVVLAACASQTPAATQPPAYTNPTSSSGPATAYANPGAAATSAPAAGAVGTVSFSKDILPIMETSCVDCHGGEKTSKGLDLKSYASLMAGSQNGAVINAGDAAASKLVASVQSGKMPKRGAKLTAEQIQLLVDWVNAGAVDN